MLCPGEYLTSLNLWMVSDIPSLNIRYKWTTSPIISMLTSMLSYPYVPDLLGSYHPWATAGGELASASTATT